MGECCSRMSNLPRLLHAMWEMRAFLLIMQSCISGVALMGSELAAAKHEEKLQAHDPNEKTDTIECIQLNANDVANNRTLLFFIFFPAVIFALALVVYSIRFTYKRRWGTLAYSFSWVELKKQIVYKRILVLSTSFAFLGCFVILVLISPISGQSHPQVGELLLLLLNISIALGMGISDLWRETPDTIEFMFTKLEGEKKITIYNEMFVNGYFVSSEAFKDMMEDAIIEFELLNKRNPDNPNKGDALARLIPPEKNQEAIATIKEMYPFLQGKSDIEVLQYRIRRNFKVQDEERDLWPWCTCCPCIPGCGPNTYVPREKEPAGGDKNLL